MFAYRPPTSSIRPRPGDDRRLAHLIAHAAAAAGRDGSGAVIVELEPGPAGALLAPGRLAELEGRFHVYLEVLDQGDDATPVHLRLTRPPGAGPAARRCIAAVGRLRARLNRALTGLAAPDLGPSR